MRRVRPSEVRQAQFFVRDAGVPLAHSGTPDADQARARGPVLVVGQRAAISVGRDRDAADDGDQSGVKNALGWSGS
jgi:hypothetical protein